MFDPRNGSGEPAARPHDPSRRLSGAALADAMRASRARTWELVSDLSDTEWQVPERPGVNPIAWELGHLAWFAEFWVLRGPHTAGRDGFTRAERPARIAGPDARFDSSQLAHAARWTTPMPSRGELVDMLGAQLEACLAALPERGDDASLYFHRLALFHEDMHAEAFCWLRAALALPAPAGTSLRSFPPSTAIRVDGADVTVGVSPDDRGFAFDNEMPARTTTLAAFEIDSAPITAGAFLRFVEAGGYDEPAFWPGPSGEWRTASALRHPARWRHEAQRGWQLRWFDQWLPIDPALPVIHVNAFEAEAWCHWAGRRLPTAAEWEHAAPHLHWGASVWEWTADAFLPHPGFVPGPYREYSAPWFGSHRELRGGAVATSPRMHDSRYRNFFEPHRSNVFAGFRTVAIR